MIDYYTPLLESPTIFNESLILNEMLLPGFNNKMTQKLLQHLGKMAQTREFFSNSIYSTIYNLISKKRINLQFVAKYPSISKFYFKDEAYSDHQVIGGYNFYTRKIEVYVVWTADSSFVVNYTVEEITQSLKRLKASKGEAISGDYISLMNSVCNQIYAIIITEGLLIYDYRNKGKLSNTKTVRDWYFEYFRDVLNDSLNRTAVGENLGALIADRYGPYMYENVEKNIIENKHIGVKSDTKGASPELDMEGIPIMKMGKKEISDIWEDAIVKIMDNNQSKLNFDRNTYNAVKEFGKEFGEFGSFLYNNRDLRLDVDNLSKSSDSTIEVYKSSGNDSDDIKERVKDERNEEIEKEYALQRAKFVKKHKDELYKNDHELVQNDLSYKWYKRLRDDEGHQRELNKKIIDDQIKKIGDGDYKKLKPGDTYIAQFLLSDKNNVNCSLSDVKIACTGVRKALNLYNAANDKLDNLLKDGNSPKSEDVQKAAQMVNAQRSQLYAYYSDFWKLMHSDITRNTSLEELFKSEKPNQSNIDDVIGKVEESINNYEGNLPSLSIFSNKKDENINVSRTYSHAGGLVKYNNTSALANKESTPTSIIDIWKRNVSNTAAKQLNSLQDSIKEKMPNISAAITQLQSNENETDEEKKKERQKYADKVYEDVYKQIQQCGFIGRAYTGKLKENDYTDDQIEAIKRERENSPRHKMLQKAIIHDEDIRLIKVQEDRLKKEVPKNINITSANSINSFIDQRYGNKYLSTIRYGIDSLKSIISKNSVIPKSKEEAKKSGIEWFDNNGRQMNEIGNTLKYTIDGVNGKVNLANASNEDILNHFHKFYTNSDNGNSDSDRALNVDKAMDDLFGKLRKGTSIANDLEYNFNKSLLLNDYTISNNQDQIKLDTKIGIQRALQLLKRKDSNIDEYENQEEARLRGIEILDTLSKPNNRMNAQQLIQLQNIANKIIGQQRSMEEARKILNVSDEDRKIGTKEAYYRSMFVNGLYFMSDIGKSLFSNITGKVTKVAKKLWNFTKDAANIISIMYDKDDKILKDYANKRFGFKNMALKDYFDDAYKHIAQVKKVYTLNHGGTIRTNMIYCELYMPVTILQKILYMQLTKQNEYDSDIIYLIQCGNKGLQEFISRSKEKSPFKEEDKKQNNDKDKK